MDYNDADIYELSNLVRDYLSKTSYSNLLGKYKSKRVKQLKIGFIVSMSCIDGENIKYSLFDGLSSKYSGGFVRGSTQEQIILEIMRAFDSLWIKSK